MINVGLRGGTLPSIGNLRAGLVFVVSHRPRGSSSVGEQLLEVERL